MSDERNPPKPASPEDRRQAELRRDYNERDQKTKEVAARLEIERGPIWAQQVAGKLEETDPERIAAIVKVAAEIRANEITAAGRIFLPDERGLVERAAKELDLRQAQQPQATPEITAAQPLEAGKQQLVSNANEPGQKDNAPEAAWFAHAKRPDLARHQIGRYDELKRPPSNTPPNNSPTAGGSPDDPPPRDPPPHDPTKSQLQTPPAPTQGPLSANEILARHNDPALQARYLVQEQRRAQDRNSASSAPDTPASVVARGNVPREKSRDSGLMADFVKPETKEKAAAEEAARANDPSREFGRGGGRGR